MADAERLNNTGIRFGDWKLVPCDGTNWELCHWHECKRGKTKGRVQWSRLGRFYQYNTIKNALLFAADQEQKAGSAEAERDIRDALVEYERIVARMNDAMTDALEGARAN